MSVLPLLLAVGLGAFTACEQRPVSDAVRERPADRGLAPSPSPPRESADRRDADGPAPTAVQVEMRNVDFHVDADIVLHVRGLRGMLVRTRPSVPASFDDKQSFSVHIASGEIAIEPAHLGRLLTTHVFKGEDSPLKNLEVSIERGRLKQRGTVHKGIDIPFTILGDLDTTPDGHLRLHIASLKAAGIPAKGLMKVFGLELDRLLKVDQGRGITIEDDDIVLDLNRLLPPPAINGRLSAVEIRDNRIVQYFGSRTPVEKNDLEPPKPRTNYMYYRGGVLRFGKLTMTATDLELIDADPRDPFDFFQDRYEAQLVAGYSKTKPGGGLETYMVDLNDLHTISPRGLRPAAVGGTTGRPARDR